MASLVEDVVAQLEEGGVDRREDRERARARERGGQAARHDGVDERAQLRVGLRPVGWARGQEERGEGGTEGGRAGGGRRRVRERRKAAWRRSGEKNGAQGPHVCTMLSVGCATTEAASSAATESLENILAEVWLRGGEGEGRSKRFCGKMTGLMEGFAIVWRRSESPHPAPPAQSSRNSLGERKEAGGWRIVGYTPSGRAFPQAWEPEEKEGGAADAADAATGIRDGYAAQLWRAKRGAERAGTFQRCTPRERLCPRPPMRTKRASRIARRRRPP